MHRKAKVFAEGLAEKGLNTMTSLKTVRPRRKAKFSRNESIDEMGDTLQRYEIETYKVAIDVAAAEIDRRFSKNKDIYRPVTAGAEKFQK